MGVPGLWEVLNKAGENVSISRLACMNGFMQNSSRRRAYRIGIDVSIWFQHANASKEGENPALRGLFFRLAGLSQMPIIFLFVFDGRQRPKVKRGSRLGKSGSHGLSQQFKKFLDAFGMEWREAPGEAEAELAYLNREGHIDAIMTDDCDTFIFGGRTLIKNPSIGLSGNKANPATNSKETNPRVALKRGGLILFALLAGGDYDKGVHGIGKATAYRLARCGFGDELLQAYQNLPEEDFQQFLVHWRLRVNGDLSDGASRASVVLPSTFPQIDILHKYAKPLHSGNKPGAGPSSSLALRDQKVLDIGKIAHLCEENFEWGFREKIIERFTTLLWPSAVMHILRRSALETDEIERLHGHTREVGTHSSLVQKCLGKADHADRFADAFVNRGPARGHLVDDQDFHPLIKEIVGSREHTSTDNILEYRIEVLPKQLVQLANAGIRGTRSAPPPKEGARPPKELEDAFAPLRLWIPAVILERVHPVMVEHFVLKQSQKGQKKIKGKQRASCPLSDDDVLDSSVFSSPTYTPSSSQSFQQTYETQIRTQVSHTSTRDEDSSSRTNLAGSKFDGFEYTFEDPDRAQFDMEWCDDMDEVDEDLGNEEPTTAFEALVDRLITGPAKSSKSRKRKPVTDPEILSVDNQPPKRAKKSLLTLLDAMI